jgi:hypothetical protein
MHVAVISAGRPLAVPAMAGHLDGLDVTWYVPHGETGEYRATGAKATVGTRTLCQARNRALTDAGRRWCVQLSDDLRRVEVLTVNGRREARLTGVLPRLIALAVERGARLAGGAPTANAYFARQRVNDHGFIVGDLMAVAPRTTPRFDERLRLKEDYDFTLQHLSVYGRVARWDYLLTTFDHRTNRGGAVAYRNAATEAEAIAYLMTKWPGRVVDNPRRPNEVLLRWKATADA